MYWLKGMAWRTFPLKPVGIFEHWRKNVSRCRLRDLLAAEEAKYLEEVEASQETMIERQAKMRERAKFLKEKREKERLEIVAEKLDQRWRQVETLANKKILVEGWSISNYSMKLGVKLIILSINRLQCDWSIHLSCIFSNEIEASNKIFKNDSLPFKFLCELSNIRSKMRYICLWNCDFDVILSPGK